LYSYGRFRFYFNIVVLLLSVSSIFFVVLVWRILDYDIVLSYVISAFVSSFCLYYLKRALLKRHSSSSITEQVEVQKVGNDSGKRESVLLLIVLLSILITPIIILFFVPRLWFLILAGIVSGASASELVLIFHGEG